MASLPFLSRRKVWCPDLWKTPTVSTTTASRLVRSHQGCGLKLRRTVGLGRAKTTQGKREKKRGNITLTLVHQRYQRFGTWKRPRRGSQLDCGVSPYGACAPKAFTFVALLESFVLACQAISTQLGPRPETPPGGQPPPSRKRILRCMRYVLRTLPSRR